MSQCSFTPSIFRCAEALDWFYFWCFRIIHSTVENLREIPYRFFLSYDSTNMRTVQCAIARFYIFIACCSNIFQTNNDIFSCLYQSTGNGITFSLIANYLWDKWMTDNRATLFISFAVSFSIYSSYFLFEFEFSIVFGC